MGMNSNRNSEVEDTNMRWPSSFSLSSYYYIQWKRDEKTNQRANNGIWVVSG